MKTHYLLICFILQVSILKQLSAQEEISVHPQKPIRHVEWYSDVDEFSRPGPFSCENGGGGNYRLKITEDYIIEEEYKTETIKTDKKEWTEDDEKEFDKKYNKEHQQELDDLWDQIVDSPESIKNVCDRELEDFINTYWNNSDYSFCDPDCKSPIKDCNIVWEIIEIKDSKAEYRYKTSYSYLTENDLPPNEVEIEFDLEIHYEAMIYFKIGCKCLEMSNLASVTPEDSAPENSAIAYQTIPKPWSAISLTGERMKPGYPFLISVEKSFPWLPVIAGVTGAGVATYFLTRDEDQTVDCDFTATSQITASSCKLANASVSITVLPADQYQFVWSDGTTNNMLQNVIAGNYTVTITRTGTDCNLVLPLTVTNTNPSFNATITTQDSECGLQNGTADVNVNPTGFYTFNWSTGGTGPTQNNMAPGNYSVTVNAGGTCTKEYFLNVGEQPPTFELTVTTTPSECGQSNGTGVINVNPVDTYTFEWSNGSAGQQVTGLLPGDYTITVTLAGTQCSKTIEANVAELPPTFEATVFTTPSECAQSTGTGNIFVNPPGAYTYEWSNGSSGQEVTGLPAGIYTITVTIEGTQCSKVFTAEVREHLPTFDLSITTTPSECGQSTGTGNITVNPDGNYSYSWPNGTTESQAINLAPGTYLVTVTIAGTSCSITANVTITELPPSFVISSVTTPSGCNDSTGTATISVEPKGEYTFSWPNGLTGPQVTGLAAGEYTVTVSITGTTCSNTTLVTVGQSGIEFTGTISTDAASCGVADGSATITIDPAGEYTYVWSDQQTGPVAQQLTAGDYSVTVTDMNGCSSSFQTTVGEEPAEYITIVGMTPGTCIGGGDITFTLSTPVPQGSGPLILNVEGPGGSVLLSLVPGTYQLSSFTIVSAGTYIITVYDQSVGKSCVESVVVIVPDITPVLNVVDDFYTTPGGIPVFENALNNDSGLNIQMTSVSDIVGGNVIFNSDGSFTFTPDQGFSGDASFLYVVTDACGTTATGVVTIVVEEVICDFTIEVSTTPASCGLSDGNIFVEVIEPGNYSYFWNTGDTGPVLTNVSAGTYTVTIEDNNLGCNLEFSISLSENPADYISNVIVTQPSCSAPGEIQFTASTSSQNQLIMSVEHPNGNEAFFIDPGIIRLSDFVSITPGQYTIEVSDAGAGPDCFENFTVTIVAALSIQIIAEFVTPPSSPSAMDGVIFIATIVQGVLPYTVFLNGVPVFTAIQQNFAINGLGVGDYTVQIRDANDCFSNILLVNVPLPDIIISFGAAVVHYPYDEQNPEAASTGSSTQWTIGLLASLEYYIGNHAQELRIAYAGSNSKSIPDFNHGYIEMQYLSELKRVEWKKILLSLDGGLGVRTSMPVVVKTGSSSPNPQFWSLRASAECNLLKTLKLKSNFSLRGWTHFETPILEFSVMMPFLKRTGYLNALKELNNKS